MRSERYEWWSTLFYLGAFFVAAFALIGTFALGSFSAIYFFSGGPMPLWLTAALQISRVVLVTAGTIIAIGYIRAKLRGE